MDRFAFEAQMTAMIPIGLVPGGARMDAHFTGTVTEGPLAGSTLQGIDYLLVRPDGTSVIDAREVITRSDGATVAVTVSGFIVPPVEMPPLESMMSPDFAWPDLDLPLHAAVRMETAIPELASLNHTLFVGVGAANAGTGRVRAQAVSVLGLVPGSPGEVPLPRPHSDPATAPR